MTLQELQKQALKLPTSDHWQLDREVLEQAITVSFRDFEDAVQYVCGVVHNVDAIVTRDPSGFVGAEILVVLPEELDNINGS